MVRQLPGRYLLETAEAQTKSGPPHRAEFVLRVQHISLSQTAVTSVFRASSRKYVEDAIIKQHRRMLVHTLFAPLPLAVLRGLTYKAPPQLCPSEKGPKSGAGIGSSPGACGLGCDEGCKEGEGWGRARPQSQSHERHFLGRNLATPASDSGRATDPPAPTAAVDHKWRSPGANPTKMYETPAASSFSSSMRAKNSMNGQYSSHIVLCTLTKT